MSYERLHSKLRKNRSGNSYDQLANAFEAEGQVTAVQNSPTICEPVSDYQSEVDWIAKKDQKLGRTFHRLNQHQRHAIFHPSNATILSAMVGSGKTTVLIGKIFYLHFIRQIAFDQIMVLTFTNKAAREIKERISQFIGEQNPELNKQLRYFGTFHSVARQIIEEHPLLSETGFKPGFNIMDELSKQHFLEELIIRFSLDIKYQNQLKKRCLHYKKDGDIKMGNMKDDDDLPQLIQLAKAEKQRNNCLDFDDLVEQCNWLLRRQNYLKPQWIIVDEFQDCNQDQLDFIELLKGNSAKLFVVGDPNQSIYGWRGSNDHLFKDIQKKWEATWIELPQNYRSTGSILAAAETLLYAPEARLVPTRQTGSPITLVRHFNDQQEAFYLKEKLIELQNQSKPLNTTAILCRTHDQLNVIETVLSQAGIPYETGKSSEISDHPVQLFLLHLLQLGANPENQTAGIALLTDPVFGCFKRNKKTLLKLTLNTGLDYWMDSQSGVPEIYSSLAKNLQRFSSEFLPQTNRSGTDLIDYLNIRSILRPTSIHHSDYLEEINKAWEQLNHYMTEKGWGDRLSILKVALDQVVLEGSFQINKRIKTQKDGVHLLTIHASKGLEFEQVFIAGANTGIIPLNQQQKSSQNLKEEKRLLFVAITRGKNKVEIGWHSQPSLRNALPEPSYFLNAIPDHLILRSTAGDEAEKHNSASATTNEWSLNELVKHKKYGLGTIISINDEEVVCDFKNVGEKSFTRSFAKALLQKTN